MLTTKPKQVRRDYLAWTPAEKDPREDGAVVIPQHGIAGHQDLVDSALLRAPGSSKGSTPATPPPETESTAQTAASEKGAAGQASQ